MFNNNDDDYEDGVSGAKKSGAKWFFIVGLMAIVFAPVTAFVYLCYNFMFRKCRMRPHLPIFLSVIVSMFFGWLLVSQELYKPRFFADVFPDGFSFSELGNLSSISFMDILLYTVILLWSLGFSLSFIPVIITIMSSVSFMKRNPAYLQLEGEWCFDWEYARTPLEVLMRKKKIKALLAGQVKEKDRAVVGLSADYETRDSYVARHNKEALQHFFIVGASGSGKSMTTLAMAKRDIENGVPLVMIDFKRSDEVAIKLAAWAHENGREFYHFLDCEPEDYNIPHSKSPCVYNPFANAGNAIPDMLVGMRQYDTASDVYKKSVSELTQSIQKMLRISDKKYLFLDGVNGKKTAIPWKKGEIYIWLKAMENIDILHHGYAQTLKEKGLEADIQMAKTVAAARKPSTQENIAVNSVRGQLLTLINSQYGQWFDETNKYRKINLYDNTSEESEGAVTLFSFSSDKQKDFSKSFGALVFQDLTNVSSDRRENGEQNDVHVYADEFQVVNPDCITGLIEKARSSKMGMTFISQSLMQIVKEAEFNGEAVLRSILDSCSNYIAHNGSNQESATILAEIIGKQQVTRFSMQKETNSSLFAINWFNRRKGRISSQQDEDWVCSPNRFTSLKQPRQTANGKWLPGEAIIINRAPKGIETTYALARKVELFLDTEVTAPVHGSLSKITKTPNTDTNEHMLAMESEGNVLTINNEHNDNNEYNEQYDNGTSVNNEIIANTAPKVNKKSHAPIVNDIPIPVEDDWLGSNTGESLVQKRRKVKINQNRIIDKGHKEEKFDLEETMFDTTDYAKNKSPVKPRAQSKPDNQGKLSVQSAQGRQHKPSAQRSQRLPVNKGRSVGNVGKENIVESHDDILKKKKQMLDRFK